MARITESGACHRQIHRTLTEKELEREYNTVEALLSHLGISRFVRWIERKPTASWPAAKPVKKWPLIQASV